MFATTAQVSAAPPATADHRNTLRLSSFEFTWGISDRRASLCCTDYKYRSAATAKPFGK